MYNLIDLGATMGSAMVLITNWQGGGAVSSDSISKLT